MIKKRKLLQTFRKWLDEEKEHPWVGLRAEALLSKVIEYIESLPSDIVFCDECKWQKESPTTGNHICWFGNTVEPGGYCHRGERKNEVV